MVARLAPQHPLIQHFTPPDTWRERSVACLLRLVNQFTFKLWVGPPWPVQFQRLVVHILSLGILTTKGVQVQKISIRGRAGQLMAEQVSSIDESPAQAILYLHGGAFCVGSPRTHRSLSTRLAALTRAEVLVPHYRRAPEAPFPAQVEDSLAAYMHLLQKGYPANRIAIAGDSAGGYLAVALALAIQQKRLPQPAALVLLSPFLDVSLNSPTFQKNKRLDPMLRLSWVKQAERWLAAPPDHPLSTPFDGIKGIPNLPPILVQVGTHEILLNDSVQFAQLAAESGHRVELEIYENRWHVFQLYSVMLKSAAEALQRQAVFLRRHWAR